MPRLASTRLMSRIQSLTIGLAYGDTAYYYAPGSAVTGLDEYGQPNPDVAETGTLLACSFSDDIVGSRAWEQWERTGDIANIDASLRMGRDVIPVKGGRFKLTRKFDSPQFVTRIFEVIGIKDRGIGGFVCALKRVEI
jgi:hypothetical protein